MHCLNFFFTSVGHISCSQEMDASPADSPCLGSSFCGQKCREVFIWGFKHFIALICVCMIVKI